MRLADGAQIGVLAGANPRNPFALYVTEILQIEGYCYQEVSTLDRLFDLLIVPDISLTPEQTGAVIEFAKSGGNLLCLRPSPELMPLCGLRGASRPFTWADRYLRLQDDTVLQYHGPADRLELAGAETLAWLLPTWEASASPHPAVVRFEDGGRRAAFTFDLAKAVVLFHQGRADQASDGPNPDPDGDGMFKPNDLFVNHLDPRCRYLPQADILQGQFVQLIDWLTAKTAPVPRLWRFPDAQPALAFFNGDSDSSSPADLALAFETAGRYGSKYTLFLKTDGFETLSPQEGHHLAKQGHEVGLHPWHSPMPTVPEFREHLFQEYAGFQERYGYIPATVRNHSLIIAGWTDTQAAYRDIGVRMDLNVYPARGFQSGFQSGTGLPVKLMNQKGQLLDFYQQATLTADDTMLTDKCDLPAYTLDGAIAFSIELLDALIHRFQGVYQPCFHPIHFRATNLKTLPWYEAMQESVRARSLRSVNGSEWCAFNEARRAVKIERHGESCQLRAGRSVQGLTLLWPDRVQGVRVNGQLHESHRVKWGSQPACAITLDVEAGSTVTLEAEVCSP